MLKTWKHFNPTDKSPFITFWSFAFPESHMITWNIRAVSLGWWPFMHYWHDLLLTYVIIIISVHFITLRIHYLYLVSKHSPKGNSTSIKQLLPIHSSSQLLVTVSTDIFKNNLLNSIWNPWKWESDGLVHPSRAHLVNKKSTCTSCWEHCVRVAQCD